MLNPLLSVVYEQIIETGSPLVVLSRTDMSNELMQLIDINGNALTDQVIIPGQFSIEHGYGYSYCIFQTFSGERYMIKLYKKDNEVIVKRMGGTKWFGIHAVYKRAVAVYGDSWRVFLLDSKGKPISGQEYINIIHYKTEKCLFATVPFQHTREGLYKPIDIYSEEGKLIKRVEIWNKENSGKYYLPEGAIRSRNIFTIEVKRKAGKLGLYIDGINQHCFRM